MSAKNIEFKRPWGRYRVLTITPYFWIKKLYINKNSRLSIQTHQRRSEIWFVVYGKILADIGEKQHFVKFADLLYVPKKIKHRITAIEEACILEIAFGVVSEDDIVRYEDDYGRV